jgi:THO complex subunit 1
LGDKSSVNLRGEFHTENVTAFDEISEPQNRSDGAMDMDSEDQKLISETPTEKIQTSDKDTDGQAVHGVAEDVSQPPKVLAPEIDQEEHASALDMDALYPIFWGLQANFSAPTRLFDPEHFASFRAGLEATLTIFQRVNTDLENRGMAKGLEEPRRGPKRKRIGDVSEMTNSFNPKYLTSRDLFELEVIYGEQ